MKKPSILVSSNVFVSSFQLNVKGQKLQKNNLNGWNYELGLFWIDPCNGPKLSLVKNEDMFTLIYYIKATGLDPVTCQQKPVTHIDLPGSPLFLGMDMNWKNGVHGWSKPRTSLWFSKPCKKRVPLSRVSRKPERQLSGREPAVLCSPFKVYKECNIFSKRCLFLNGNSFYIL